MVPIKHAGSAKDYFAVELNCSNVVLMVKKNNHSSANVQIFTEINKTDNFANPTLLKWTIDPHICISMLRRYVYVSKSTALIELKF